MDVKSLLAAVVTLCVLNISGGTLKFECSADRKDAIYKAGEKIVFTIKLTEDGKPAEGKFIHYRLFHDGNPVKDGKVSGADGLNVETSSNKPAWVRIQVWAKDAANKFIKQSVTKRGKTTDQAVTDGIGAVVEPEKFLPVMQEPEDFDAFWNKVKKELAAVPMKELERVPVPDKRVKIYDVKIACAGEMPVSGYLCIPLDVKPKSCPAFVSFHGAGVRSANKPVRRALQGLIALDINAHGIINGQSTKFYDALRQKELDRYFHRNKDNRDRFYFKGVYMRLMRALEYIKSQPEWDGKNLIVVGDSQGGAQVLAACALDHDITFARAGVPAMCDHSGCLGNRCSGWPRLYTKKDYEANPAVAKCAAYYDGAYFARRIRCPIWINTGFIDNISAPSSVFAAYNSIPAGIEKHMQTCPNSGHSSLHSEGTKAVNDYINSIFKN